MGKGIKIEFPFVPMPLEAFDPDNPLREAGLRLLAYILKHTRFGEAFPEVSYEELLNGIVDQKGRRLDSGCGLSRNGIKNGQAELEERGWLEATNTSTDKSRPRWKFRLILGPREVSPSDNALSLSDSGTRSEMVSPSDSAVSRSDSATVTKCEVPSLGDRCNKEERKTKYTDKELEKAGEKKSRLPQTERDSWDLRRWQEAMRNSNPQPGEHIADYDAHWRARARRAAYDAGLVPQRIIELLKAHFPNDRNIDLLYVAEKELA